MGIIRIRPEDWRRSCDIRLRALTDAPDAFGSTLEQELAMPDEAWQARLTADNCATFIAMFEGRDMGVAVGAPYDDAAGLFAMWIAPEARGKGLGDELVKAVIDWAHEMKYDRIFLDVADQNLPAIDLYARHGFEPTGETGTLPPPREHVKEHQRVLNLA